MTTPEFMPVLSAGAHQNPKQGACVMEYVSILAGEKFSDRPACTHPVLAKAAMVTNDSLLDTERHLLVPLIPRLIGTADTQRFEKDRVALTTALAEWCYTTVFAGDTVGAATMAWAYLGEVRNTWSARTADADASAVATLGLKALLDSDGAQSCVTFLTGLIDVHAELTGHQVQELREGQWIELTQAVGR